MTEPKKFLRMKAVLGLTGMCKASIYNYMKAGKFPKQIPIGEHMVAWDSQEVEQWQLDQIAAARQAPVK